MGKTTRTSRRRRSSTYRLGSRRAHLSLTYRDGRWVGYAWRLGPLTRRVTRAGDGQ